MLGILGGNILKNLSIRLEEDLIQLIEKILEKDKTKKSRSAIISESLDEYILNHYPSFLEKETNNLGPSVLSQIQSRKKTMKGPSFRFLRKLDVNMEAWKKIG
jgi:metal-responsive CopG/Arc/MetJ family transcriptional regulator